MTRKVESVGKVWLVGAGPGDARLLTVRGLRALEGADVIVADRLGARGVLDGLAAEGVELSADVVDVGKRPGHHAVPQDAINALLVQLARDGKRVVRLKGGDPYVFGRGVADRIDVTVDKGNLMLQRTGMPFGRGLLHLGDKTFHPAGAAAVRVRFAGAGGTSTLTITDGDIVVTATRRS